MLILPKLTICRLSTFVAMNDFATKPLVAEITGELYLHHYMFEET